jgi:hypothetical protein
LADDHPFSTTDGNRGVGSSAVQITSVLAMCFEKGGYVLDPVLQKELLILFFQQEKDLPFLDEGIGGWDGDIL